MVLAEAQELFEDVEHFREALVVPEFLGTLAFLVLVGLFLFERGLEISDDGGLGLAGVHMKKLN